MTISRVSHAIANGDTLTMPSHQAGDLIIAVAYRNDSATAPTVPSGWFLIRTSSSTDNRLNSYYRIAVSSAEAFGTWTNATQVAAVIYRETNNYLVPGGRNQAGSAATTDTITYGLITSTNNLQQDDDRYYFAASGYRANNTSGIAAPTGMTTIANIQGTSAGSLQIHDSNGLISNWNSNQTVTGSSLIANSVNVIEIFDTRAAKPTAAAALPSLRGGFGN